MIECKHPQEALMGTGDGIICRACGATFQNWEDYLKAVGEKPVEAQETPKKRTRKKATE